MSDWHLMVVEGHGRELRTVVAALLADRNADVTQLVLGDDVGLGRESLHERLRGLLTGGRHTVLVSGELAEAFTQAIARAADVGLHVTDRHPVASASFGFSSEVFSREVAASIRNVLGSLPAGVALQEHSEQEEQHADAKGVELYTSAHDYTYRVRGKLAGAPPGVLEMRRRLAAIEAVTLTPLELG